MRILKIWFNKGRGDYMKAWIKASRIPAQLFIFPALLLGQAIAFYNGYAMDIERVITIHLYGIFMHLFIVYGNDYADYESDKLNQTFTPFTGGSRVLVDNLLSKADLKKGFMLMGGLSIIMSVIMSFQAQSIYPVALVLIGLIIFQMYSFSPVKLSYRGYGETLQVLGVGIILPLIGYTVQSGGFVGVLGIILIALLPSQLAMALSTSMPDYPSDLKSQKHTTVVNFGTIVSKYLIITLYTLTAISLIMINIDDLSLIYPLIGLLLTAGMLVIMIKYSLKPGSLSLFYFVALSIFINTYFVLSVGLQFILM